MPMPLLTSLLVLIIIARLLGQIFKRFGQTPIVGEMLAGVLLGPSVFNVVQANVALSGISDLAVFLIVLSAGLEMDFKDVMGVLLGRGVVIAILGFVIPLAAGIAVGIGFDLDIMRTVFLGLCISITALPVTVRILQSFGLLDSAIARYSVATAIFNDIAALLALGVILTLPTARSFQAIAISFLSTSGKFIVLGGLILGFRLLVQYVIRRGIHVEKLSEKLVDLLGNEAIFGMVALIVLVFASVSEVLGFHFVIGAFFGALLIDKTFFISDRYQELERTLGSVTGGFLAPVFFAYLGLEFNIGAMGSFWFVTIVLVVSILSKVFAGWIGAKMLRLPAIDCLGIGIILNGRGVIELVVANIAYKNGFINQGLFSTLVLMGVLTTMITPMMFKKWVVPHVHP